MTRALEIVSEASRRLPDYLKNRQPGADWQAVAAGNVYWHEYEVAELQRIDIHDWLQDSSK